ncbi:MAG TPA: GNAT family N-acetyltransferase, partial [Pseudorhizobium sp.]|nr:GNAT family N-acetyltransferase [Pseudorhizobium sp.]
MHTIRNARKDEIELLAAVGLRAWEKAMASIGGVAEMRSSAREAFRNFARSSWLTITVLDTGGSVGGWAAREKLDELITDFWIDPQFQRQGLGSTLLAAI